MKRLFFICLFVTLTGTNYAINTTHANEWEENTSEKKVVIFSPVEQDTPSTPESLSGATLEDENPPVTIKQMKENLEELRGEKSDIWDKWKNLSNVNGKILDFLKTDLSDADISTIQSLSVAFQWQKAFYEQQLKDNALENYDTAVEADNDTAAVKENFIQQKLDFYKSLVPYINTQKKDEYFEYIKSNIVIEKQEKDIKEKIYKQEWVIEERVWDIKEKIKSHKKALEEKLEQLIYKRIKEKIQEILQREQIQNIPNETKAALLQDLADRLQLRNEQLTKDEADTEYTRKRAAIYKIAIQVLTEEISALKK